MGSEEHQFGGYSVDYWFNVRIVGDDEARWAAIDAIRHLCVPDVSIQLLLDTLANDSYWRSRALAAHAIYDLAWNSEFRPIVTAEIPELVNALHDTSREVREQVIVTLELLGDAAAAALDQLWEIASGDDSELSVLALAAIQAINA